MNQQINFADSLDPVDQLAPESQAELLDVIKRRLAEQGHARVAANVEQARREFATVQSKPMTAAEIVREAQS